MYQENDIIKTKEDLKYSLEEIKINKEKRKALYLALKEKDKINCLLFGLKKRFNQILVDNQLLPESIRFPNNYFQLDERINSSLIEKAQLKMDELKFKLAYKYKKSEIGLKKVKNFFVDNVITTEFEVKAILYVFFISFLYICI